MLKVYSNLFSFNRNILTWNITGTLILLFLDKLLRIVEKYEGEKNNMRMDLASQTQKLVESKLMIQQLHDQNTELHSDLQLSINLLRNRPTSFMSQRLDTLPPDIQQRVRTCIVENAKERQLQRLSRGPSEGRKIRVAIPSDNSANGGISTSNGTGDSDKISAAILAKVLEERDKERQGDKQLRIDVGTQTQGWNHFPGTDKIHAPASSSSSSSSTASCINKEICELTNEAIKGDTSALSSPENSSLAERLSPIQKVELSDEIDNGVNKLKNTDTLQESIIPNSSTVQPETVSNNSLNFVKDGPTLPNENFFTPAFISNSCRPTHSAHSAFTPQQGKPNDENKSTSSSFSSNHISSSNLTRSSSTITSTNFQPNVIQSSNVVKNIHETSTFSSSVTSTFLTRSATFSAKQTDI